MESSASWRAPRLELGIHRAVVARVDGDHIVSLAQVWLDVVDSQQLWIDRCGEIAPGELLAELRAVYKNLNVRIALHLDAGGRDFARVELENLAKVSVLHRLVERGIRMIDPFGRRA